MDIMFSDKDQDLTLYRMRSERLFRVYGQQLAVDLGRMVTARDPITDKVLATFWPAVAVREAAE